VTRHTTVASEVRNFFGTAGRSKGRSALLVRIDPYFGKAPKQGPH
jgi:hypothetical protein